MGYIKARWGSVKRLENMLKISRVVFFFSNPPEDVVRIGFSKYVMLMLKMYEERVSLIVIDFIFKYQGNWNRFIVPLQLLSRVTFKK